MKHNLRLFFPLIVLFLFFETLFSMGKKSVIPVKTFQDTDIPDGEYLHYVQSQGGEKTADYYYVTVKITNISGGIYYKSYMNVIAVPGKKPDADYRKWPAYFIIDPAVPTLRESTGSLSPEETKNWDKASGLVYWHYLLNKEKGYAEYSTRMVQNHKTNDSRMVLKYDARIPCMDVWSGTILVRFLDCRSPGIFYSINPMMKEPMATVFKYETKETLRNKTGAYSVNKFNMVSGDPFLGKLLEPMLKTGAYWQENNPRRLFIRNQMAGISMELDEISNVLSK